MRFSRWIFAALALGLLAACGPAVPTTPPPLVVAPKQLATVMITPTPVHTLVVPPTATPAPSATRTPIPPTPTPSPTPYVGIFMGDGSAPLVLPTDPVVVVEATLMRPTPLGGIPTSVFASATPPGWPAAGIGLPVGGGTCIGEIAAVFRAAYEGGTGVKDALGCPTSPPETLPMAEQPFENGRMFWNSTREIFALATVPFNGVPSPFWRIMDNWQEGMPPDDPSLTVPEGRLQPVRGFGLAWRTTDAVRSALGWALTPESGYTGTLQRFERGVMITTQSGSVFALINSGGITTGQYIGPL
ncbi:MAG: hypothetical protein Kow0077_12750 [Anaerolineae bacterium]